MDSFTAVWLPSTPKSLHIWASSMMGQNSFFLELLAEDDIQAIWSNLGHAWTQIEEHWRCVLNLLIEVSGLFGVVNTLLGQQVGKLVCPQNPWKRSHVQIPETSQSPTSSRKQPETASFEHQWGKKRYLKRQELIDSFSQTDRSH